MGNNGAVVDRVVPAAPRRARPSALYRVAWAWAREAPVPPSSPPASPLLLSTPGTASLSPLPPEILLQVAGSEGLGPVDLLALSRVSRGCRAAADDDHVWRALLLRKMSPVWDAFFDGHPPPPRSGLGWKQQYFELRRTWKRLAGERSGRLLVQIGEQHLSGRGRHEVQSLFSLSAGWGGSGGPANYGVYDVTEFSEHHPGIDLREAVELPDATDWFEMAAHSDAALRRLTTLVVPGLQALPYQRELDSLSLRRRGASRPLRAASVACIILGLIVGYFIVQFCHSFMPLDRLSEALAPFDTSIDALSEALAVLCVAAYVSLRMWTTHKGEVSMEKAA